MEDNKIIDEEENKAEDFAALDLEELDSGNNENEETVEESDDNVDESLSAEDGEISEDDEEEKVSEWERWGKDKPHEWKAYIAKKAKKEAKKEYLQQLETLQQEVDRLKAPQQPDINQGISSVDGAQEEPTVFYDEESGLELPLDSPEGRFAAEQWLLKKKRAEFKEQKRVQEYSKIHAEKVKGVLDQVALEAKRDPEFKTAIVESLVNSSKPVNSILDFVSYLPNNAQNKFLFYLSKNKKEVERIASLNDRVAHQELIRHYGNFSSAKKVSSSPEPIDMSMRSTGYNKANDASTFAGAEAMIKARYKQG